MKGASRKEAAEEAWNCVFFSLPECLLDAVSKAAGYEGVDASKLSPASPAFDEIAGALKAFTGSITFEIDSEGFFDQVEVSDNPTKTANARINAWLRKREAYGACRGPALYNRAAHITDLIVRTVARAPLPPYMIPVAGTLHITQEKFTLVLRSKERYDL